jgi:hypothetical protein
MQNCSVIIATKIEILALARFSPPVGPEEIFLIIPPLHGQLCLQRDAIGFQGMRSLGLERWGLRYLLGAGEKRTREAWPAMQQSAGTPTSFRGLVS